MTTLNSPGLASKATAVGIVTASICLAGVLAIMIHREIVENRRVPPRDKNQLLGSTLAVPVKPRAWPVSVPFRPLRHYGPFTSGSTLERIQLLVGYTPTQGAPAAPPVPATWYYNDFFDTFSAEEQASKDIYKLYYRTNYIDPSIASVTLPSNQTPVLSHNPEAPPGAGAGPAHNILLSLHEVASSSRNGGSVRLGFRNATVPKTNPDPVNDQPALDEFQYEFAIGDYLFDVGAVRLDVYVTPDPTLFNARQNVSALTPIVVDVNLESVTAYRRSSVSSGSYVVLSTATPVAMTPQLQDALAAAVAQLRLSAAQSLVGQPGGPRGPHPILFAHAFIHAQHSGLIGSNDRVTRLLLSDTFIDITTAQYQPYIFVEWSFMIDDVAHDPDDYDVILGFFHQFEGQDANVRAGRSSLSVEDHERSRWLVVGAFHVNTCDQIEELAVTYVLKDDDEFLYPLGVEKLKLSCNQIRAQAALTNYIGEVADGLDPNIGPAPANSHNERFSTDRKMVLGVTPLRDGDEWDITEGEYDDNSYLYWSAKVTLVAR